MTTSLEFTVGVPFDPHMPPEGLAHTRDLAIRRNPGYDVGKLHHMLPWDTAQFERTHLPAVVGVVREELAFSEQRGLRVLDLAIRMPGLGWAVPQALQQFEEVIALAVAYERSINPDFDEHYYVYITVDQKLVEPGKAQRRVGWHSDAYVSPETNDLNQTIITDNTYVAFDTLSTLYLPGPFSLKGVDPTNDLQVLARFDEVARAALAQREPVRYPPYTLLRMTPYDIHTPDMNTSGDTIVRTFVKITCSRDRLNMMGNAINRVVGDNGRPVLNYDGWTWVARDPTRRNNRNSILGWDRPDRDAFRVVQTNEVNFAAATPGASWAGPSFFWAKKTEGVEAEPAHVDEQLETVGAHGSFRSTFNIAQPGDWKLTTSQGDQYFLSETQFRARYRENGGGRFYAPRGLPQQMVEVTEPICYRSPWGAWAFAPAGSVLTRAGAGDVYAIMPENFRASFSRCDADGNLIVAGGVSLPQARRLNPKSLIRVRDEDVRFRGPYLAVFDLHGTLAQPNWKVAMERVYLRLRGCEGNGTGSSLSAAVARDVANDMVERIAYGASDAQVMHRMAESGRVTVDDVERLFREERAYVGQNVPLEAMPGAPGFLSLLCARGIQTAVVTFARTPRERTMEQLRQVDVYDYVLEQKVITADRYPRISDREEFRSAALRSLQQLHPAAQILFFNDTVDGMQTVRELGGINFGIPQGEGADWENRAMPLVNGGAHYLLQDWTAAAIEILGFRGLLPLP